LKYAGGKAREIKYFSKYFPSSFDRYIENFVGGGAVYFYLNPDKAIINDLNYDLINFYKEVKLNGHLVVDEVKNFSTEKYMYNGMRTRKFNSEFMQAVRYFYLNKTAYSGLMRYNSKGEFNTPYGNYKNPNFEIKEDQIELIKRTDIYNCDFKDIPITYKKDDFCFIDPPYSGTWGGYNKVLFTDKNQEDLYHWFLNSLAQVMIVINKVPLIENLYKRYIKNEYNITYGIDIKDGQKKVKTHLIITNY
jgi:DNA adenine methylase